MIAEAKVSVEDVVKVVASRGHYPEVKSIDEYPDDFLSRWVVPNFKKIVEMINVNKEAK